jgi:ABC-2 type transport system ATP-binding protein
MWALDTVDLAIRPGTITALVGPNGAGKSTLIRTWVGFERPTRGSARVLGLDPWREPGSALAHVGYIPQTPRLYDGLTVTSHLDHVAHIRPAFDWDIASSRLRSIGIDPSTKAGSLSGGQQAQVALAIALGATQDVLLLDEPLAHLDPLARRDFLQVVVDASRDHGTTCVLSSHIVSDIAQVCSGLIVLARGRIVLNTTLADALATHSIGTGSSRGSDTQGMVSAVGPDHNLIRHEPDDRNGHVPASLDEIVIGYLEAARSGVGADAG